MRRRTSQGPGTRAARRGRSPMTTVVLATSLLLVTGAVGVAAVELLSDPRPVSPSESATNTTAAAEVPVSNTTRSELAPLAPGPARALSVGTPDGGRATSGTTAIRPSGSSSRQRMAPEAGATLEAQPRSPSSASPADERRAVQRDRLARLGPDADETTRLDTAREVLAAQGTDAADHQLVHRSLAVVSELDPATVSATVHELLVSTDAGAESQAALARALVPLAEQDDVLPTANLVTCYDLGSRDVQRVAAEALARRGDDSLSQRFAERCADELLHADGGVRAEAVRDLAELRAPELAQRLAPLLADAEPEVRLASLRALEHSTDPLVQDRLRALVDDPEPHVRSVARRAVKRLDRAVEGGRDARGDESR
jgi:hypothetical protein